MFTEQNRRYITIIYLFGVLSFLIIFTTLGNLAWTAYYGGTLWYLGDTSVTLRSLSYMTLTAFILYHTLIPISLPVTLDVVRFIQAHFISLDCEMYDEESNSPAIARTSNLNEDLGQVRRIFSDKTGTLTKNIMQFKRCSIGYRAFGIGHADASVFDDLDLEEQIAKRNADVDFFFTTLALCHTVMPELTGDRTNYSALHYMASSPDEKALVEASRRLGYVFLERDADSVILSVAAHIGVGIIGKEGTQAVSASDFAIGQFRFLKRLLFVHGVWDYSRITDVVLYCFYKNCCLYLILFWFNWWTGFSGTILFERWTIAIYNVAFTAAPPLAMGIFDRIYPEDKCLSSPAVFYRAHRLHSFNLRVFLFCLLDGTFHSLILFAVSALAFRYGPCCILYACCVSPPLPLFFLSNHSFLIFSE
nr:unnamed protein product [Spirometra erinaceieuropaei]